ncbi:MAG TPA: FKBP-type peptidyl-prolyl cis-trans isomerase [Acidimicrobiales bacterium]|nr:FKBP-type peptidyl-prolyl cis-trans isomerase [Acidimicrobiales bacterium]
MLRARSLVATLSTAAVLLTGCGSSHAATGDAGTTTTAGTAASTVQAKAPAGSTSSTLFTSGPVPAVTGATDMAKEPVVAAGAGAPPTSLTGKDLVSGTGPSAGPDATVTVQYVGALWSGKVFDASWTDQGPATFQLSGVIPGFKDAIIGMKVGGRREIVIPPALGYGSSGQPPTIPGNATLVFVIDLLQTR